MNKMVKKWYDICLEAEVAEDEVLEDEEAKKDLTKEEIEYLLDSDCRQSWCWSLAPAPLFLPKYKFPYFFIKDKKES